MDKSLKNNKRKIFRSVRKRWERIKILLEKNEEVKSFYSLPKEKIVRFKIKKEVEKIVVGELIPAKPLTINYDKPKPKKKKTSNDDKKTRRK